MAAEKQVREIRVVVDTKGAPGLKEVADGFGKVNTSINKTTSVLSSFKNAFLAIQGLNFAGIGLDSLVKTADGLQKLTDRLKITEGSTAAANDVLAKLATVANNTKVSIEDISTVYQRLTLSLGDLGVSSFDVLKITEALQQSFRLSGSTAAEATASTIQLAQGLASGQLRGQELRSVLEQNVVVGGLLAKQLGITRGELLKFAEKEGGIKAQQVIAALSNSMDDLNNKASALQPTVKEALDVEFNKLKITLNNLNQEFGLTAKLVSAIEATGSNLLVIAAGVTGLAVAWGGYTIAVKGAALATGLLATALSSGIVGGLVKAGIVVAGFAGTVAGVGVAITAMVTGFVLAFSVSEDFRNSVINTTKSVAEFISLSFRTKEYQENYRKAAEEAKKLEQAQADLSNAAKGAGPLDALSLALKDTFDQAIGARTQINLVGEAVGNVGIIFKAATPEAFDFKKALAEINKEYNRTKDIGAYGRALKSLEVKELNKDFEAGAITLDQYQRKLIEINLGRFRKSTEDFRVSLADLNKQFDENKITLTEYYRLLDNSSQKKADADLKAGKTNRIEYTKATAQLATQELRRLQVEGKITNTQFDARSRAEQLKVLNAEVQAGTISMSEYHQSVVQTSKALEPGSAFFVGAENYIKTTGTLAQNIAGVVTGVFVQLEDKFIEFTKTGKANFKEMANAIIEDLNRILVRAIVIQPLAQGLTDFIAPSGGGASGGGKPSPPPKKSAKGSAFDGTRSNFFATGGVVTGRSSFAYSGGRGVMGEAGPEAILPLARNRGGELGVVSSGGGSAVTVNIINNAGVDIKQTERENPDGDRILDLFITNRVKDGIANGSFDRQMASAYALKRKGV